MTNADKIRNMNDDDLAIYMYRQGCCPHYCEAPDHIGVECTICWLVWLKEEAIVGRK